MAGHRMSGEGNAFCLLAALFLAFILVAQAVGAYNYDHVNVSVQVNVTNAPPEILSIDMNGGQDIFLLAGTESMVYCNATIRDWNGFNDISNVNATFYYFLNASDDGDDMNEHYTNSSCAEVGNDGEYIANYSCSFPVQYFANNGSWTCNLTALDNYAFTDMENVSTNISALYALNVTDVIDYGNLSVTEYSDNITATVTNFGNSAINVSVLGYGAAEGDGLGFVCTAGTNITVENQRFSSAPADWNSKSPLAANAKDFGVTLLQQLDDNTPVTQSTYWQLYIPPNPFGVCTGTIKFAATVP